MQSRHLSIKAIEQIPGDFTKDVIQVIDRILSDPFVKGIVYFRDGVVHLCTVPTNMQTSLTTRLPLLSPMVHQAVTELDIMDELVAYRISTSSLEILVAGGKDIGAVVVQGRRTNKKNSKKQRKH